MGPIRLSPRSVLSRPPQTFQLWACEYQKPLYVCPVAEPMVEWVHWDPARGRCVLHERPTCSHCLRGVKPQARGYCPAFILGADWSTDGRARVAPSIWTQGVLEVPEETIMSIEANWPMVFKLERLDHRRARVRAAMAKPPMPPPSFTQVWPILPILERVYGVPQGLPGGAK